MIRLPPISTRSYTLFPYTTLFRSIKGLSLWGAVTDGLKRSLGLNRKPNDGMATKTLLESFRYPRLGPGMMWEAARDFVIARGNRVLMAHSLEIGRAHV